MPDLARTIAELQALASTNSIEVQVEPDLVRVIEQYRSTLELTGSLGEQRNQWEIQLRFHPESAEYELDTVMHRQMQGRNVDESFSSSSSTKFRGTVREVTFERGKDRGGEFSSTFRSKELEDAVTGVLHANGWQRRRGFWGRLFGRR